jgi:hypothetical protein
MAISRKVTVGTMYEYKPVGLDIYDSRTSLKEGDKVKVVNLPGCPKANTMGHCHVTLDGKFAGLVLTNSLQPITKK